MSSRRKLSSALIVLLAAALPLTACSSSSEKEASTSSATREFTDVHGTTEVPENPQRVVVLEPLELDTAIALEAELSVKQHLPNVDEMTVTITPSKP